tara:strand:+ start:286 stop:486 length:201 start_codon:yes stop_codon:yes gene_type:complete
MSEWLIRSSYREGDFIEHQYFVGGEEIEVISEKSLPEEVNAKTNEHSLKLNKNSKLGSTLESTVKI